MTKRLLSAAAVALLSASVAHAATITYTLQVDDAAAGGAGKWGLYVDVSADCGGLAAFNVTLNRSLLTGAAITAPRITYQDSNAILDNMTAGFTFKRQITNDGVVYNPVTGVPAFGTGTLSAFTGAEDLASGAPVLPVYGFGQSAGTFPAPPAGYDGSIAKTQTTWAAHLQLATGTYNTALAHSAISDWFKTGGDAIQGNLFTTAGNTTNSVVAASVAIAGVTSTTNTNTDSLSATTVGSPDVTVNVTRIAAGGYVPTVALVNGGTGLVKGTANIVGPITEAPIWVMAKIIGTDAANVIGVLPNQTATAGELADLHAKYDALFPGGSFNALFKFTSPASAGSFSWDMTGWNAQVSALAAVPEPASLGLVALGALGLLARRRK